MMKRPTLDAHPLEEQLERYSMGKLSEAECAPLEEHLLICSMCRERLTETDQYVGLMRVAFRKRNWAEQEVAQPGFLHALWPIPKPAWAATFALVCVLSFVALHQPAPEPEIPIALQAVRGVEGPTVSKTGADRPIHLTLDLADLPDNVPYRVEIVNWVGNREWDGESGSSHGKLSVRVSRLSEGLHWVRLYSGATLVREYGLKLQ